MKICVRYDPREYLWRQQSNEDMEKIKNWIRGQTGVHANDVVRAEIWIAETPEEFLSHPFILIVWRIWKNKDNDPIPDLREGRDGGVVERAQLYPRSGMTIPPLLPVFALCEFPNGVYVDIERQLLNYTW